MSNYSIAQCLLCKNEYDDREHMPFSVFPCEHMFCEPCLVKYKINYKNYHCPSCGSIIREEIVNKPFLDLLKEFRAQARHQIKEQETQLNELKEIKSHLDNKEFVMNRLNILLAGLDIDQGEASPQISKISNQSNQTVKQKIGTIILPTRAPPPRSSQRKSEE